MTFSLFRASALSALPCGIDDWENQNIISHANLLPGSIICLSDASVTGSKSGKLYVRDDLDLDTWEHHNVVARVVLRDGRGKETVCA